MAGGLLSSAWVNAVQLVVLLGGFLRRGAARDLERRGHVGVIRAGRRRRRGYSNFFFSAGRDPAWAFLFLLAPGFVISPGLVQKVYGARTSERCGWASASRRSC